MTKLSWISALALGVMTSLFSASCSGDDEEAANACMPTQWENISGSSVSSLALKVCDKNETYQVIQPNQDAGAQELTLVRSTGTHSLFLKTPDSVTLPATLDAGSVNAFAAACPFAAPTIACYPEKVSLEGGGTNEAHRLAPTLTRVNEHVAHVDLTLPAEPRQVVVTLNLCKLVPGGAGCVGSPQQAAGDNFSLRYFSGSAPTDVGDCACEGVQIGLE